MHSFDFDPGDQCPIVLRINCLNSVDTSHRLFDISFGLGIRLVCSNGMMFGVRESRFRKRHVQSLDPGGIAAYPEEELERRAGTEKPLQAMAETFGRSE